MFKIELGIIYDKIVIDSIQLIDPSFELLSMNYIYFIENHEKKS